MCSGQRDRRTNGVKRLLDMLSPLGRRLKFDVAAIFKLEEDVTARVPTKSGHAGWKNGLMMPDRSMIPTQNREY